MKNNKLIVGISVVALILAGIAFYNTLGGNSDLVGATPGSSLPIENYVPAVKYNGGIYSELPIQTTSDITAATSYITNLETTGSTTVESVLNVSGNVNIAGSTTTISTSNTATSSLKLGCIQTTATSTATPVRFVIGSSGATTSYQGLNSVGVVGWQYGTCPI